MPSQWPLEAVEADGLSAAQIEELAPACSLPEADLRERKADLRENFLPLVLHTEQIADGYIYWFERNDKNMALVAEFALFESRCCNFLSFGIGLHPQGSRISLRITGPRQGPEFLREAMQGNVSGGCCS